MTSIANKIFHQQQILTEVLIIILHGYGGMSGSLTPGAAAEKSADVKTTRAAAGAPEEISAAARHFLRKNSDQWSGCL